MAAATASKTGVSVFVDGMSQPARAVHWFCRLAAVPHTLVPTNIGKLAQRAPDYLRINPLGKVPALVDHDAGDFALSESHAMMRYLATTRRVDACWYGGDDACQRARIDRYLDWHHIGLRAGTAGYLFATFVGPTVFKQSVPDAVVAQKRRDCDKALRALDTQWLGASSIAGGAAFIAGEHASIADLSAYAELASLRVTGVDFDAYPNVAAWMRRMEALPHYDDVHAVLRKVCERAKAFTATMPAKL